MALPEGRRGLAGSAGDGPPGRARGQPTGAQPEDDRQDDPRRQGDQGPDRRVEPVDPVTQGGVHREPPRQPDRGDQQGPGTDPGEDDPGPAPQDTGHERDGSERERHFLDQEGDGEGQPRGDRPTRRAATHGLEPDDDVEEGEGRCRDVEPGRPRQIVEVWDRQDPGGGEAARGRPDSPTEQTTQPDDGRPADRTEQSTPGPRIDPQQGVGCREDPGPQRRMGDEGGPEDRRGTEPGPEAVADPEVLLLVEAGIEARHRQREDQEDHDGAAEHDGGQAALGRQVKRHGRPYGSAPSAGTTKRPKEPLGPSVRLRRCKHLRLGLRRAPVRSLRR